MDRLLVLDFGPWFVPEKAPEVVRSFRAAI